MDHHPDFSDLAAAAIAYMLGDERRADILLPAEVGPSDEDLYDPVEDAVYDYDDGTWYWDDDGHLSCADCHSYLDDANRCKRCDR